jgi:hypothetical protein
MVWGVGGFLRCPPSTSGRRRMRGTVKDMEDGSIGALRTMRPLHGYMLLHGSYLDELSIAGECAAEYLALYQKLIASAHWKVYLAARGVLPYVGNLITKVFHSLP